METTIIVVLVIALEIAIAAVLTYRRERDEALDLNEEILDQLDKADKNLEESEEETSRQNLNYQAMRRKKLKLEDHLLEKGRGPVVKKLLLSVMSEKKYLKAKQTLNELSTNKDTK